MKEKIDFKEIKKLIDILEEKNLSEFELEIEGFRIRISKNQILQKVELASDQYSSSQTENISQQTKETEKKDNRHIIRSPMVGTFYNSPDPSSSPFIEKGENVNPSQTICIIEAMKLMNEIESDIEGIIDEIFVENGNVVEYGQKLFAIKPL